MRSLIFLLAATAASAAPDPAAIARRQVTGLGEPEIFPVGRGWVARFRQTHASLPVIGGEIVLRLDSDGTILRQRGRRFDLSGLDVRPALPASRAIEIAHAPSAGETRARLAVDAEASGGPRLVWVVRGTPIPQLLENAVYLIDARSGQRLKRIDLIKYGKASVFLQNPVETPQPATRDIPADFEPTNPNGFLEGALLKSYDCIDSGQDSAVNLGPGLSFNVHICTVTPEAQAADYDYTIYAPAQEPFTAPANGCPNAPAGGTPQPLDQFSEQHMYWHVANVYAFFRGLFSDNGRADFRLRAQPLAMAVNLCTPNFSGGLGADLTGPLVPFDNAFFSPGANNLIAETLIMGQDSIMFGQGSKYDFAYDADVIDHEFTHAVIDTLQKLIKVGQEDSLGLQDDQGAMNEGLADYFSSIVGGDPILGEYAGRNIPGGGAEGAVRDLTNGDLCGRDRWGEVHQDSQAFSSSLWGARTAIAGDPKSAGFDAVKARKFDRAVLAAIAGFAINVDMTTAAQDISKETLMLLDADSQTKLEASFTMHGILPQCDRVIDWSPGYKKDLLGLDGTDSPYAPSGAKRVPGFVQWKIDVPAGADSITAQMTLAQQGGSFSSQGGGLGAAPLAPKLELIVGPPETPIDWVVNTDGSNEAAATPYSGAAGAVTATLTGLPVGTSYVMIVNSGGGIIAENLSFDTSCSVPGGCQPDMAVARPADSSGCKCDLGGRSPTPALPLVLWVVAMVWMARRRFTSR